MFSCLSPTDRRLCHRLVYSEAATCSRNICQSVIKSSFVSPASFFSLYGATLWSDQNIDTNNQQTYVVDNVSDNVCIGMYMNIDYR